MSTPFCINGLAISASSKAKKPPLRAASAISTIFSICDSGVSILNIKALPAILPAPKNCPSVYCDKTTKRLPQNTINIDGTLTNIAISPPCIIAIMTKPIDPSMPIRVAKSTIYSHLLLILLYSKEPLASVCRIKSLVCNELLQL